MIVPQEPAGQSTGVRHRLIWISVWGRELQAEQSAICLSQRSLPHKAKLDQHIVQPLPTLLGHASAAFDASHIAMTPLDQQAPKLGHEVVSGFSAFGGEASYNSVKGHREAYGRASRQREGALV